MGSHDTVRLDSSFEAFHRAHRDRLVASLALHLGNLDLATDAVDHAMAKAWGKWADMADPDDAGAWVYRVALNWATSWLRRLRFRSRQPLPDTPTHDRSAGGDQSLRRALSGLSDDHRAVVVLRLLHEMSTKETALALDIPEGTVKSRLARALDQLRSNLNASEVRS
ncbi:MAG TPA: sigma-70 family RNA polymerase sigma factor [Nitriliruptoraceae bacterium]|nr:sigma-70 family RNA polymerase sigma factor [Nitriliruptoraceae bacterium]